MEIDFFLSRFKSKTNKELEDILNATDGYVPAAVEAANQILKERQLSGKLIEAPSPGDEILRKRKNGPHPFNPKPFIKSYSKNDLLSLFCLSMTLLAVSRLNEYYRSEDEITGALNTITISMIFLLCLINNIFFKKDHLSSNNFIGRCFNDVLLMFSFIIMTSLYELIEYSTLSTALISSFTDFVMVLISLTIISLLFEALVSLFQFLFSFLKWRLL